MLVAALDRDGEIVRRSLCVGLRREGRCSHVSSSLWTSPPFHYFAGCRPVWSMALTQWTTRSSESCPLRSPSHYPSATRFQRMPSRRYQIRFRRPQASRHATHRRCDHRSSAAQFMVSRSQQSRANVTRSGSPLSQRNSNPSEHQRWLFFATATLPSCRQRSRDGGGLRCSSRP